MPQETLQEAYVDHPRIVEGALEARTYQEVIAASAIDANSLVVLPTGLGKTAVSILVAAQRLEQRPNSKILMLAPTKPLAEQHRSEFERCLNVDTGIFEVMTGETRPEKRAEQWKEVGAFFATPQSMENDLINGRVDLSDFSLVIFDEVHRAVGDYPYTFIAEQYVEESDDPRILGLTASPGGDKERIEQVAANLSIENVEARTADDPDVEPYVEETETNWIRVTLSRNFERVKKQLEAAERTRLKKLKGLGLIDSTGNVHKKELLNLRGNIGARLQEEEDDPKLYQGISHVAACMKVEHALELLETQGVKPLYQFFEKMEKDPGSKASRTLLDDENFRNAMSVAEWMVNNGKEHPKLEKLVELMEEELGGDATAIVFTQYRNTVDLIHDRLERLEGATPVKFKGQKEGFTQKRQMEILDEFRAGEYNVLCSTSVGEEGLDIPSVDYVVFYEPIPSEIRTIQRRGRTGRQERGEIYVLMAEDTRDEGHYWSAKHKEESMREVVADLRDGPAGAAGEEASDSQPDGGGQKTLDTFSDAEDIVVVADDRENAIMKALSRKDIAVRSTRMEVGDFLVSNRTAVERKTAEDFVTSIIDNRLFPQLQSMVQEFERPVLLIEGTDLYGHRDIHPNAVRGALSSVALDFGIPIMWSTGEEDTVDTLIALARREQEEQDRSVDLRGERTPKTENDLQEYLVAGLPNVSTTLAERLLDRFGSAEAVFTASETDLKEVAGIGEEKAGRIREILQREYG